MGKTTARSINCDAMAKGSLITLYEAMLRTRGIFLLRRNYYNRNISRGIFYDRGKVRMEKFPPRTSGSLGMCGLTDVFSGVLYCKCHWKSIHLRVLCVYDEYLFKKSSISILFIDMTVKLLSISHKKHA